MSRVPGPKEHRTVSRVTTILETVASDPHGVSLGLLAGALDAPKSSVHALVGGLVAKGYLREQDGGYVLGPAVTALLVPPRLPLAELARPVLEDLRERFDETVMLATLVGRSVVYVDAVESTQLIRYSPPLRRRRPIYPTSSGKALLAQLPPARREELLSEALGSRRQVTAALREIEAVAGSGLAFNRGETVPDISAVASPVETGGRSGASIAIAGPSSRMAERLEACGEAVAAAAAELGRRLA